MTFKLLISAFALWTLLLSPAGEHPIKLTSSEIKYDTKTNSLSMECKVFIDDFAPAINHTILSRINTSSLTKADKVQIEYYFLMKYKIFINNNKLPLKFESYEVENNVMSITFSKNHITLEKGDELHIENELLFEVFGDVQSNWMTMRFPPFLPNYNFESKLEDYSYSHTF